MLFCRLATSVINVPLRLLLCKSDHALLFKFFCAAKAQQRHVSSPQLPLLFCQKVYTSPVPTFSSAPCVAFLVFWLRLKVQPRPLACMRAPSHDVIVDLSCSFGSADFPRDARKHACRYTHPRRACVPTISASEFPCVLYGGDGRCCSGMPTTTHDTYRITTANAPSRSKDGLRRADHYTYLMVCSHTTF